MKRLEPEVTAQLKNVSTLDVSGNGIESLEGVELLKRLKRLIARNNQVRSLEPLKENVCMVEIDLENNPVDSYAQFVQVLANKKDILYFNLKLSPLMLTIQNYD